MKKKHYIFAVFILIMLVGLAFMSTYLFFNSREDDEGEIEETRIKQEYNTFNHEEFDLTFEYPVGYVVEAGDISEATEGILKRQLCYIQNDEVTIIIDYALPFEEAEEAEKEEYENGEFTNEEETVQFVNSDFSDAIIVDSEKLLISKDGGYYFDDILNYEVDSVDKNLIIGRGNNVYEIYSNGEISSHLNIFQGNKMSVPGHAFTIISYTFHSQEAINKWPEYKGILKEIIGSLEKK